jgi:hypothetical protein
MLISTTSQVRGSDPLTRVDGRFPLENRVRGSDPPYVVAWLTKRQRSAVLGLRTGSEDAALHAQLVRLAWSVDAGRPVEQPSVVARRYAG